MTTKTLWVVVGLLATACIGEGVYIWRLQEQNRKPAAEQFWKEQDKWFEEARKGLFNSPSPVPFRQFDELFDDKFFGRKFDPFAEIESFEKRLYPHLRDEERSLFGKSWHDWFGARMGIADIRPELKKTGDKVILSFKIPKLDGESLKVDVNEDRIRLAFDAKTVEDRKDEKGGASLTSQSERHYEKVMPVPEGADPKTSRVQRDGDTVKIIFDKLAERKG